MSKRVILLQKMRENLDKASSLSLKSLTKKRNGLGWGEEVEDKAFYLCLSSKIGK